MGIVEYYLPIQVVQIKFSTPNRGLVNPKQLRIGRNENFTEIDRVYVKFDTTKIPSNAIIQSATMSIPVIYTQDDDGDSDAHMMGYSVISKINNVDFVYWNNLPNINVGDSVFDSDIHANSLIEIDLTKHVKNFVSGEVANNGFLFINNEAQHNEAIFDCNLLSRDSFSVRVRYYNPNDKIYEKNIQVETDGGIYYLQSISSLYFSNISIFVKNLGYDNIKAMLEVSSNNIDFIEGSALVELTLNESSVLVPYYVGKYLRVKLITDSNKLYANINVQAQLI